MRPRKIEKLSATLEKILSARGWGAKLREYRIFAVWEKIVGGTIARHARPAGIRGKKLTVIVDSSAWLQQLTLLRPEILEKVNVRLGENAVESITLRLGEVEQAAVQREELRPPAGKLDEEEQKKIDAYVASIPDAGVRESLRHVIAKDLLNKKRSGKRTERR